MTDYNLTMKKIKEDDFEVAPRSGGIYHMIQTTYTIGDNAEYRVVDLRYDDTPDIPRLKIYKIIPNPDRYLPEINIDCKRDLHGNTGPISFTIKTEDFGNLTASEARKMIADYEFGIAVVELLEKNYFKEE